MPVSNSKSQQTPAEEKFSLPLFSVTVLGSLAALVVLLRLLAPRATWLEQVSAAPMRFAAAFLAVTLLNCFIEYFFHRYVLHKPVIPFLSHFYRQHTQHHSLTRIGRRRTPGGREVPFVENIFPITTSEQNEASFFPWYTLAVFAAIVTPLLALAQWLAPAFPWFFAGYGALAASLTLYEVFHAIEHWPFEKWAPLIEHPRFGTFWRKVYSFHLRHHAVIDCNEAISGFFTLPVSDWVFGTFVLPRTLYTDGGDWQQAEFSPARPYAFIRWCDARVDAIVQGRRAASRDVQDAPVRYSRGERFADYLTHGVGLAASIASLGLLLVVACLRGNAWHIATFSVFGVSLVLLYAMFAFFGSGHRIENRKFFDRYKHPALFLLIAGTVTPFLLANSREAWGWSVFGIVWGLCIAGGVAKLCAPAVSSRSPRRPTSCWACSPLLRSSPSLPSFRQGRSGFSSPGPYATRAERSSTECAGCRTIWSHARSSLSAAAPAIWSRCCFSSCRPAAENPGAPGGARRRLPERAPAAHPFLLHCDGYWPIRKRRNA